MNDQLRVDAILMEILHNRQTVTGFLDAIFGFLRRSTDFYHIKRDNSDQIGFAKGVREQILFGAMQRYDPECRLNRLSAEAPDDDGEGRIDDEDDFPPPAVQEIEVETEESPVSSPVTPAPPPPLPSSLDKDEEFSPADYRNGAVYGCYCWSQTLNDVELLVKLPPTLSSAKQLSVEIKSQSIAVRSRLEPDAVVAAGQLSAKCRHNDAVWTLAEGRRLLITFDKAKEAWWDRLFVDEPEIDMKKIVCERFIDELPEESQAQIHKLRVQQMQQDRNDEQQRESSDSGGHETETLNRLRKAWDAENSPFKGQPFDPSVVKFS